LPNLYQSTFGLSTGKCVPDIWQGGSDIGTPWGFRYRVIGRDEAKKEGGFGVLGQLKECR